MKYLQFFCVSFVVLNMFCCFYCTKSNTSYNTVELKTNFEGLSRMNSYSSLEEEPKTPLNFDLTILKDEKIYFQGWLRYYHYSLSISPHISKPKVFFQIQKFFLQTQRCFLQDQSFFL